MTTITLGYDKRNKVARAIVDFIEATGLFKIMKDEEPNEETKKAIEDVKSGKTFKASNLQDMFDYLNS
ncbi:MAG: hypothetical protein MJZ78_00730 [Bacteroidales bacterium]|nr:hypothetical protein [Bacteroidales bacterium]